MARVYRECRAGKLDLADGSKLSYQLQGIGKMIEATVVESRLTALENQVSDNGAHDDLVTDVDFDYVEIKT